MILHSYWRSTAAYRVRIALNVKGIPYSQATHDLRAGAHKASGYRAINPQGLVPALVVDGLTLTQSPAILEWLEEGYPGTPLLPAAVNDRAIVRAMAALVACDIHPINNLRVLNALRGDLGADQTAISAWIAHWIDHGFDALEPMVARHGRGFAFGETLTIADCCIVPQVYSAQRFGTSLAPWPHLAAAAEQARAVPAVAAAHPDRQPDADA
jgi:maleylpyruvate isomerase